MKLREVQKALGLHYLNLNVAIEAFDAHGLRGQNDKLLDVPDMITVLSSLYETISAAHPTVVNVPLCLDLTLNWMLNVYDWYVYRQIILAIDFWKPNSNSFHFFIQQE